MNIERERLVQKEQRLKCKNSDITNTRREYGWINSFINWELENFSNCISKTESLREMTEEIWLHEKNFNSLWKRFHKPGKEMKDKKYFQSYHKKGSLPLHYTRLLGIVIRKTNSQLPSRKMGKK